MSFDLHHEIRGDGETVVFVHGGWTDATSWRHVAPQLEATHRVVTYDRRGHSRNGPSATPVTRRVDEDDLIRLLTGIGGGRAHLVGTSYGAVIVLGVAARRPDLVRTVVAHEPVALGLAAGEPWCEEVLAGMRSVADAIESGDVEGGVEKFVDEMILGAGWYARLPEVTKTSMLGNAGTFLDLMADPTAFDVDVAALAAGAVPVLLTDGTESPAWLRRVVGAAWRAGVGDATHTFAGSGHMPHITDPDGYVAAVLAFAGRSAKAA